MRPSKRHRRDARLISAFREAYVELLNNTTIEDDRWSFETIVSPSGVSQDDWNRLYSATAVAAGAAAAAYRRWGSPATLRNAAYTMHSVDLVANWEMSLRDPANLDPQRIVSAVETAAAEAWQEAQEAAERERGITGFVARFIRWPITLREAVGPGPQRTAAGIVGVLGQLAIGVVASLLAAELGRWGIDSWR